MQGWKPSLPTPSLSWECPLVFSGLFPPSLKLCDSVNSRRFPQVLCPEIPNGDERRGTALFRRLETIWNGGKRLFLTWWLQTLLQSGVKAQCWGQKAKVHLAGRKMDDWGLTPASILPRLAILRRKVWVSSGRIWINLLIPLIMIKYLISICCPACSLHKLWA